MYWINFFSFGYPHYLHTKIFPGVNCVWADVICLYWPWALSKASKLPELEGAMSAQPCLSVMHAKAHSWHCQVNKLVFYKIIMNRPPKPDSLGWQMAEWSR
jgi:hypothetical protein